MFRAAVSRVLFQFLKKQLDLLPGNAVNPVIVIAELRKFPLCYISCNKAFFIADRLNRRVFYSRKRICQDGKPRDAESHKAADIRIVQSHLCFLVSIFIMHIMNHIQGIDIGFRKPCPVKIQQFQNLAVFQNIPFIRGTDRAELLAGFFVASAVEAHQQKFRDVCPCAEILHFLADAHSRNTAGDGVIITGYSAHHIIVFILDSISVAGYFSGEFFEVFRQRFGPENGQVRLR